MHGGGGDEDDEDEDAAAAAAAAAAADDDDDDDDDDIADYDNAVVFINMLSVIIISTVSLTTSIIIGINIHLQVSIDTQNKSVSFPFLVSYASHVSPVFTPSAWTTERYIFLTYFQPQHGVTTQEEEAVYCCNLLSKASCCFLCGIFHASPKIYTA
jgi:hypothetical protein